MITQSEIKYLRSLSQRKFRQKYNKFIAEGDKICSELLKVGSYSISHIYGSNDWVEKHVTGLPVFKEKVTVVSDKEMAKISQLKSPPPVLMVIDYSKQMLEKDINGPVIYLDEVQDPGNVGTIIRIADWYGVKYVVRSEGTADFYSHKVIQASMASFANVGLHTAKFEDVRHNLKNHVAIGAVLGGLDISDFQWPEDALIIMGNEGKGIRKDVLDQLDKKLMLPGSTTRLAESLNVGIATALMCQSMFAQK